MPLDAFRNGTLNYINDTANCDGNATLQTDPACISNLSATDVQSLDPTGTGFNADMLSYINSRYPHANDFSHGDGVNTGGYRFTYPSPDNDLSFVTRVDYNLTPTQKIFGRFTIEREDAVSGAPMFPTDPLTHPFQDRSYAYVVNHTWNIGVNKVNSFYYGDTVNKLNFPDVYNPFGDTQPSFGNNPNSCPYCISDPYTAYNGQKRRFPVPMVRDDFNWQFKNHTLAFGGTFKFMKNNSNLISDFNFPTIGSTSGLGDGPDADSVRPAHINQAADHIGKDEYDALFTNALGVLTSIQTNYSYDNKGNALPAASGTPRAYRFYQTEAYFGDTWKVNRKLTMSYGVRWQYYTVPYETKGFQSVPSAIPLDTFIKDRIAQQNAGNTAWDGLPLYSIVLGGKANHGPDLYAPNYKDFAPRVAFAFSPFDSQKTVFNVGGGIVYDRSVIDAINFLQDQISYLFYNTQYSYFDDPGGPVASLSAYPRVGQNLSYDPALNPAPAPISVPYTPYVTSYGLPYGLYLGQTNFVVDPHLKDPYSITLNAGIQQQLPWNMILKLNYVGRLGRRLLADADANQVIDVPDFTGGSTQSMSQAFAALTTELRAGMDYTNVTPQPWFEDVLYQAVPGLSNTAVLSYYAGTQVARGDISDAIYYTNYFLGPDSFFPNNIGIPGQFGSNTYLTNKGSSNYHAMLVTLDKNMSNGLRFEFNYTWSHSIDNTSVSANSNSLFSNGDMICDILHPRACRGDSDFDVRQEISSNFLYRLPIGRGKTFMATAPRWADEIFGGWSLSGIPSYRTGLPASAMSGAYMASFDNLAPAIFTGNRADLKASVNQDSSNGIVYLFKGGHTGAADVLSKFRGPLGIEYGSRNIIRGPGAFFLDAGLGKTFPIIGDQVNLNFRADAFNVLNHPNFTWSDNPYVGANTGNSVGNFSIISSGSRFGQLSGATTGLAGNSARVAQLSLRLDF